MQRKKVAVSLKEHELVFVTENEPDIHFSRGDYLHVGPHNEAWSADVLSRSSFVERWLAESDNSILQLIPYIICVDPDRNILSYRRKGGGEGRLEGKKSIGIGGHVNHHDKEAENNTAEAHIRKIRTPNTWDIVLAGAHREIQEELGLPRKYTYNKLKQVATIYTPTDGDASTPLPRVGEVHLGIIYMLEIPSDVRVRDEEGMIDPQFISNKPRDLSSFELWSQMVFQNITDIKALFYGNKI